MTNQTAQNIKLDESKPRTKPVLVTASDIDDEDYFAWVSRKRFSGSKAELVECYSED